MNTRQLAERALLVNVSISQWGGRKKDKALSQEIENNHSVVRAGNFNKILVLPEKLAGIRHAAAAVTDFHQLNTLPWDDTGSRLLPAANYLEYIDQMVPLRNKFDSEVYDFFGQWDGILAAERTRLNGLFRESEYPAAEVLKTKFGIRVNMFPAPEPTFNMDIPEEQKRELEARAETVISDRIKAAHADTWERISKQLTYMRDRLSDPDAKLFEKPLQQDLRELVKVLPRLNLAGDPKIFEACEDLENLIEIPIQDIRSNPDVRQDQAAQVKKILSRYSDFF